MTPPHIEKAARAIFPAPFQNWQAVFSGWLEMGRDETEASHKADLAHGNEVKDALAKATLVWSLARAHTIEEAAKVGEHELPSLRAAFDALTAAGEEMSADRVSAMAGVLIKAVAAIRALAVEG